jgi:hypothetical protein
MRKPKDLFIDSHNEFGLPRVPARDGGSVVAASEVLDRLSSTAAGTHTAGQKRMVVLKLETDVVTESDVEQKIVMPLLTSDCPSGLGISPRAIRTKPNIRHFSIGKGKEQKLYYPDYIVVLAGLPVLVVEAKAPGEDLEEAYREARLYAAELNSLYPSSLNPASKVICTDGRQLIAGGWDTTCPEHSMAITQNAACDPLFGGLLEYAGAEALERESEALRARLSKRPLFLPTKLVGGHAVRNEEIEHNTFGAALSMDYRHLFNPTTKEERAYIVRNAYVPSRRRQHYVEPIDKIIRAASPPSEAHATLVQNTDDPREIVDVLRRGREVENQILLLVGGVGSGKSTFVDYLREVALTDDLRQSTVWVHLNMNNAPLSRDLVYDWLMGQIIAELQAQHPSTDFDALDVIKKLYSVEVCRLKKGALQLLERDSQEYNRRLADEILRLQSDKSLTSKALIRYLCAERGKLLLVVLDNCDKRVRDEQLLMFQAAQWLQQEYRCITILPLRDETYDNHRFEPPLDTALKDLVFRIEPPLFDKVLGRRIELALQEANGRRELSYYLPNGMRVEYAASEQAYYLLTILRSVLHHDRLIRRLIVGLAGRDLRRAMEIFLQFCTSGHIGEDEILKIRHSKGMYTLPHHVVARVILRGDRRFYDGDSSYVKNLFGCVPEDTDPSYLTRYAALRWLEQGFRSKRAAGLQGYHPARELLSDLLLLGLGEDEVWRELLYLLKARCIIAEHLRTDSLADDDLIRLGPAGFVHLDLVESCDYLAAVAEDTWLDREDICREIAHRLASPHHYSQGCMLENAQAIVSYLTDRQDRRYPAPDVFLNEVEWRHLVDLEPAKRAVVAAVEKYQRKDPWFRVQERYSVGQEVVGLACSLNDCGLFVRLEPRLEGLVHASDLGAIDRNVLQECVGKQVTVRIRVVDAARHRLPLELVSTAA